MNKLKDFGVDLADKVATFVGSWKFIIWQSIILIIWMFLNVENLVHFDPYPFILMNLLLSSQAAYATPMILMSANRQSERDREQMKRDLDLDEDTNLIIKTMHDVLIKLEQDLKLDRQTIKDHADILDELKKINKNEPRQTKRTRS
jgi:uncharacterized membrane protein